MCNKTQTSDEEFKTAEKIQLVGEARRDYDIQQAKKWLNKQQIKKSGYNKSLKYSYYEFTDFIGYVQRACEIFDLSTHFTTESIMTESVLRPKVKRNEADQMPTFVGIGVLEVKSLHYHEPRITRVPYSFQVVHTDTGNAFSYAKRYAYMIAFEISEADMVEATNTDDQKPQNTVPKQWKTENNTHITGKSEPKDTKHDNVVEDETWKKNSIIKSLHTKMTERSPKAFLDKSTTAKFAQLEFVAGNISEKEYQEVHKILK